MAVSPMRIEEVLKNCLNRLHDSRVKEAMAYSLLAGGKRIRPNLLYETLKGYGKQESCGDEYAAAIEMIHSYSLIHDDLRRGRPTCHKQFDEATAILAGDGLLTFAFETCAKAETPSDIKVRCIAMLARMAGADGMVHGQDLDMNESQCSDWNYLVDVHTYKTGCLLSIPLMIGACLCGQSEDIIEQWHSIGNMIGLAFQIQDDILDVQLTPEQLGKSNSDTRNEKVTSVTLLGMDKAEKMMNDLYTQAEDAIRHLPEFDGTGLLNMVEQIRTRRI